MKRGPIVAMAALAAIVSVSSVVRSQGEGEQGGPPPPPPPREIPGLNAPDPHPNGCVDCHVQMKEFDMDVRISTHMQQWIEGAEPRVVAAAKAAAADSTKITGRHPKVPVASASIPKSCLVCHASGSAKAPPFGRMMHLIHLTGGDPNLYMGYYQGDCTHCHKLDIRTGQWSVPSAKEPAGD